LKPPPSSREPQRIAKLLARAGIASRREIERMIEERRIAIDGTPVEKPATLLASLSGVTVDGKPVQAPAPARLFRYHKPSGLLTTERDPQGRPTIYNRLPAGLPRLMPVGRLDLNTEGLLLLTTDGGLKRQLELPSSGIERVYRARVFGEISQDRLEGLIQGIEIEGIRYGAIDANLERRTGRNAWLEMRLTEGKNREVRRVLEYLGLKVSRLIRTAYGPFALADLPTDAVDEVRQHDLVQFMKWLADPSTVRMEPIAGSSTRRGERGQADRNRVRQDRGRGAAAKSGRPLRARPGPGRPGKPDTERPSSGREGIAGSRRPFGARPGPGRPGKDPPAAERPDARRKSGGSPQRVLRAKLGRPPRDKSDTGRDDNGRAGATRPRRSFGSRPGPARPDKGPSGGRGPKKPRS
jgi:23S rRNA pseudouridine2605 synthase